MAWDPIKAVGPTEPLYFGPLAGYNTDEFGRRGLDQDKNTAKGIKCFSENKIANYALKDNTETKSTNSYVPPFTTWDDPPPRVGQEWRKGDAEEVPTWDEFSQKTTFHGVRYIFDKTPFRTRRYFFQVLAERIYCFSENEISQDKNAFLIFKNRVKNRLKFLSNLIRIN